MRASLCICACCAVLRSIRDQLGRGSLIERSTPTHLPQKQAHTNVVLIIIVIIIIITKIITITISHHITSRSSSILNDQRTPPTEAGILQYNQAVIIIIIIVVIMVHLIIAVMVTLNNQAPHTSHSQVVITVTFFSKDEHDRWKYVVNGFWRQAHPPCHTWVKHKTAQQARLLKHPPYYCIFIWVFFPLYFVYFLFCIFLYFLYLYLYFRF